MAENENIACTCSVSDLGEPPGQLLGYRDDVLLANGSLGDNRLTFPVQTLGRHDNGTVFRCEMFLDWAKPADRRVASNLSVSVACELFLDLQLSFPAIHRNNHRHQRLVDQVRVSNFPD